MATVSQILNDIWQFDSGVAGPKLAILGGVHGDEGPGIEIVRQLLTMDLAARVHKGSLYIGYGNPDAIRAGARSAPGDFDLNRAFGTIPAEFIESKAARRAAALKPILSTADMLLDFHSTIKPSRPMLLCPNATDSARFRKLVRLFGIETVVTGAAIGEESAGLPADAFVARHGGLGMTIECGASDDFSVVSRFVDSALATLSLFGLNDRDVPAGEAARVERYDAYWSVPASDSFSFVREWESFAFLPRGAHFATDAGTLLVAPEDSYMLFQKPASLLKAGVEACLLLRKIDNKALAQDAALG